MYILNFLYIKESIAFKDRNNLKSSNSNMLITINRLTTHLIGINSLGLSLTKKCQTNFKINYTGTYLN